MKKIILFLSIGLFFSLFSYSQSSPYEKSLIGTWSGKIYSFESGYKKLSIVITSAQYRPKGTSTLSGYTTVNGGNKTSFSGTFRIEGDVPVLTLNEPGNSNTDGKFFLHICPDPNGNSESLDNSYCGTWKSYNGKWNKDVMVQKN